MTEALTPLQALIAAVGRFQRAEAADPRSHAEARTE